MCCKYLFVECFWEYISCKNKKTAENVLKQRIVLVFINDDVITWVELLYNTKTFGVDIHLLYMLFMLEMFINL